MSKNKLRKLQWVQIKRYYVKDAEVSEFLCPNCGRKWHFFFRDDGYTATSGSHKCKHCGNRYPFEGNILMELSK